MRNLPTLLLYTTLALFAGTPAVAGEDYWSDADFNHMTLNGIDAFAVAVDEVTPFLERHGVTTATLRTQVETRLRENGVSVVSMEQLKRQPDAAVLHVKLRTNRDRMWFYFYGLSLNVKQKIPLNNAAGGFVAQTIWTAGRTGTFRPSEARYLNDYLNELLADFTTEYRGQNAATAAR
ncbi:MAG: hypothetical protein HKO62_06200 [Gammaproteobacteria bacterium]|nr:hypothetical protein [Gammaproteobacteria bacterium]NNM00322.1 hypothetical protein [Gammaproteobacteria bacterium]